MLISGITAFLFLSIVARIDRGASSEVNEEEAHGTASYFYDGDFVLSVAPGFHDEEFYLAVSIPRIPRATIYWTIDGTEPTSEEENYIQREGVDIQVSGSLDESGQIFVADRTTDWRNSILMYHSREWVRTTDPIWDREGILPIDDVEILQGVAFRFRGFIGDVPVTETVTATYIIEPNFVTRFNKMPVIAITAPYEDFLVFYANTDRQASYRSDYNYEFFTYSFQEGYMRRFSLPGSSSLSGSFSRSNEQRSLNYHRLKAVGWTATEVA